MPEMRASHAQYVRVESPEDLKFNCLPWVDPEI